MRAFLFRKLEIEGVNYYQLYDEVEDFENSPNFSSFVDFSKRMEKDYFYTETDGDIKIDNAVSNYIYVDDDNNGLKSVSYSDFDELFDAFEKKYNVLSNKAEIQEKIINEVNKNVLFQELTVTNLVKQIYLNQTIMNSDLPIELKLKQKNNILFHGPLGSGKKSIIEIIEKNIDIPYADIIITGELTNDLANIMKQLLSHTKNDDKASKGIVFIRDNFLGLMETYDDKLFSVPSFFTSQEVITYGKHKIDFRTLTFVVLFDDRMDLFDDIDIKDIQNMADCECNISTQKLFDVSKYQILLSENGRLRHYERFLNQYNKKMIIDEKSLRRIIRACSSIDPGMNLLNSVIDAIIKTSLLNNNDEIHIDKACADLFVPVIASRSIKSKRSEVSQINEQKETIFKDELKDIYNLVTKNVVGQDKQVKTILYTILQNRRMANKDDLIDAKKYIKNILIRGESGSGKTLIVETISKILGIPFFIADATQYTEEGYVGSSVTDMLISLYHAAGGDLEKAQRGILVIDEIDKKVNGGDRADVSRGAVLDGLLKIIEGAVIPINVGNKIQEQVVMFDTSRLTVICSGAFEGIEKCQDDRLGKRKVGFSNENDQDIDRHITDEDYVAYGMKKQFMARLPVMVELNPITPDLLVHIMKESSSSALLTEKTILGVQGIEVEYTENFYEALAKEAYKMKVGARGISKALERVLASINIENIEASEISKIIFDGNVINDPNKVVLVPRKKSKQKIK